MSTAVWSAPGSLLIAGEYLITEEGRRGLVLAAGPRARLEIQSPSGGLSSEGRWPGGSFLWKAGDPPGRGLPDAVYASLRHAGLPIAENRHLLPDTSGFYGSDGSKSGFGSSAATALLLTRGMVSDDVTDASLIGDAALRAHRDFQGGRGSGYDVLTSLHGGCGVFIGGSTPSFRAAAWPQKLEAWLIRGPRPVSTADAIARYETWKNDDGRAWNEYAGCADELMDALSSATDASEFTAVLYELAEIGSDLGQRIGVPARPVLPAGLLDAVMDEQRPGIAAKCLGAGDEMILLTGTAEAFEAPERHILSELSASGQALKLEIHRRGLTRDTAGDPAALRNGGFGV